MESSGGDDDVDCCCCCSPFLGLLLLLAMMMMIMIEEWVGGWCLPVYCGCMNQVSVLASVSSSQDPPLPARQRSVPGSGPALELVDCDCRNRRDAGQRGLRAFRRRSYAEILCPHQRLGLFLVRHARRTSFSLLRPCLIQSFITSSSPGCRPLTPCPLGLACVLPKVQIACYRKEQNSNKVTKSTRQQTQVLFWKHLFAITHAPLSITSFLSFHSNALSISHQPPALGAGFTH